MILAAFGLLLMLGDGEEAVRRADPEPPASQTVDLGDFELELSEDQPIQHCVIERYDRVSGDTVLVVTAVLTPQGPFAGPPVEIVATGPLAALEPLMCVGAGGVVEDAD